MNNLRSRIVATIEARMTSSRLPGKVLKKINGISPLECQVRRLQHSKFIDKIVIATTINQADDVIEEFARSIGCDVFRGSEDDVMHRILGASEAFNAEIQVQLTGDCPLADSKLIDQLILYLMEHKALDLVSNSIERSYPIGLDCRIFKVSSLRKAEKLCKDPVHRTHGSTYLYDENNRSVFKTKNFIAPKDFFYPNWRWTLDTQEDFNFLEKIFLHFDQDIFFISSEKIVEFLLSNPEILNINSHIRQKNIEEG